MTLRVDYGEDDIKISQPKQIQPKCGTLWLFRLFLPPVHSLFSLHEAHASSESTL